MVRKRRSIPALLIAAAILGGAFPASSQESSVQMGALGASIVRDLSSFYLRLCAGAVFQASMQNGGRLVTSGTVRESPSGEASYSPLPADHLRLEYRGAYAGDFTVLEMEGDFSGDAAGFLEGDHLLKCRVADPASSLELASRQLDGQTAATSSGSFEREGVRYRLDAAEQGSYAFEVGSSAMYEVQRISSGRITSDGFALTIDEAYRYKSLKVDRFVENVRIVSNSHWTIGADRYRLSSGEIAYAFADGAPADVDSFWEAQGVLLRNGEPFGRLAMERGGAGIELILVTPDERLVLTAWPAR